MNSLPQQQPLFEDAREPRRRPAPLARTRDPASSRLAAERHVASGRQASAKAELLAWLRNGGEALTSREIAEMGSFDRHAAARLLPVLARDGAVLRGPMRTCRFAGTPAITWAAKERR